MLRCIETEKIDRTLQPMQLRTKGLMTPPIVWRHKHIIPAAKLFCCCSVLGALLVSNAARSDLFETGHKLTRRTEGFYECRLGGRRDKRMLRSWD